jgi:uncharacterized protein with von Willebrand factor type A (vWA) domain
VSAPKGTGKLAENILHFARTLRAAGLPVGPGAVLDAVQAVEAVGIGSRADFFTTLHAVFVKRREQTPVFRQAFEIFWKKRGFLEKLISLMSPMAQEQNPTPKPPPAGAARVADAFGAKPPQPKKQEQSVDMRLTMSAQEVLQRKDFAQMSAEEIAKARALIAKMRMPDDLRATRRWRPSPRGGVDARRTMRRSLRAGGQSIDLVRRKREERPPPLVALCDISGSMSDYSCIFLHFLHALTEKRRRVRTFLFGTRLTDVTRALQQRDIDEALALCSRDVRDWSGGTRIGESLRAFNKNWARRVLAQGATVLLITDGLERDDVSLLGREAERLSKSCRRLIWLNPLLRFDGFEPKALGVRALLPHVDRMRAIHSLASMRDLIEALSRDEPTWKDAGRGARLRAG